MNISSNASRHGPPARRVAGGSGGVFGTPGNSISRQENYFSSFFWGATYITVFTGKNLYFFPQEEDGSVVALRVGGAATRCQYQSPCYDAHCRLCYDPLLRIHGRCGGASYFTCRGTLPRACLPFTCSHRVRRGEGSLICCCPDVRVKSLAKL